MTWLRRLAGTATLIVAVFAAPLAVAETVKIRSGNHPSFVRLVLPITAQADWKIGRTDEGYALELNDPAVTFDTAEVFGRIPRTRLAGLQAGRGRLGLKLACNCHVTAYLWKEDRLVIDIVDGLPPGNARFEGRIDDAAAVVAPVALRLPARQPWLPGEVSPSPLPAMALPDPFAEAARSQDRLAEAERALLESLSHAASQGVLEINPPGKAIPTPRVGGRDEEPDAAARTDREAATDPPPAPPATVVSPLISTPLRPGVVMQTSVDRDRPQGESAPAVTQSGAACLDDRHFDVASWGDDRDFQSQMADRHSTLTSEFDVHPAGAVEALARGLVYFGFGREALQAMELDGVRSQDREILKALAKIVDHEPLQTSVFDRQTGCLTPVVLWASLARNSIGGTTQEERTAIVIAYRALPESLRGHIGNKLARLFHQAGDPETAMMLLATARPAVTADRVVAEVAQAEVTIQTEGKAPALARLQNLAAEESRLTPEAVLRLIELSLDQGRPVQGDVLILAATLRHENRGSDMAAALVAAEMRAIIAADRFDDAFVLLDGEIGSTTTEALGSLRSEIVGSLVQRMPDAGFVEFAFSRLPVGINSVAVNAVAARLIDLGFAEHAAQMLSAPAEGPDQAERRYLRAAAALSNGNFMAVELQLAGMTDARAGQLRSTALAAQGDFSGALVQVAAIEGSEPDSSETWRAGAWDQLGRLDDPLLQAAASAVLSGEEPLSNDRPLAERRALLEQSAATRALATDLLSRFSISTSADPLPGN
jgi:hypothetical protein